MPAQDKLTPGEMRAVTMAFKQYETGLREACIDAKVSLRSILRWKKLILQNLLPALVSLGLNMMEQEVIDLTNTISKNGLVFFPDFSQFALKKIREEDEELFAQEMFKVWQQKKVEAEKYLCSGVLWYRPPPNTLQGKKIQNSHQIPQ